MASSKRSISIKLTMKLGTAPEPPPRAVLRPEPHALPATHGGKGKVKINDFVHLLALPTGGSKGINAQNDGFKFLEAQLSEAESFLIGETTLSERKAYKACKAGNRAECYAYLSGLSGLVEENEIRQAEAQENCTRKYMNSERRRTVHTRHVVECWTDEVA